MLRRQRQIHTQIQKLVDAGLFAFSFWLAYLIRSHSQIEVFGGTAEIEPFEKFLWLYLLIIPFSPLVLEYQGFYDRPLITSRRGLIWDLLKGCTLMVMAVIVVMFLRKAQLSRSAVILFGPVSFIVVLCKEELLRRWLRSKIGQAQTIWEQHCPQAVQNQLQLFSRRQFGWFIAPASSFKRLHAQITQLGNERIDAPIIRAV